jgi:hypothetical protein
MSLVTEILTYDQIHDLWGAGFTIVRRNSDPFEIDAELIPLGMSYQWNPITPDGLRVEQEGWKPVPYSRHPGVFAPWGMSGFITRDGLALEEKPQVVVDLHRGAARAAAERQVSDWADKAAADGLSGSARIGTQTKPDMLDTLEQRILRSGDIGVGYVERLSTKTVETTAKIPADMFEHMADIFAERDRLEAEVVRKDRTLKPGLIADRFYAEIDADKGAPWWPTLRAIILPIAIDNVRANLKKDTPDE